MKAQIAPNQADDSAVSASPSRLYIDLNRSSSSSDESSSAGDDASSSSSSDEESENASPAKGNKKELAGPPANPGMNLNVTVIEARNRQAEEDMEADVTGFTGLDDMTLVMRNTKRGRANSSAGSATQVAEKRQKFVADPCMTVFIKGTNFKLADFKRQNEIAFKRLLDAAVGHNGAGIVQVYPVGPFCIVVKCRDETTKGRLLGLKELDGRPITVTLERAKQADQVQPASQGRQVRTGRPARHFFHRVVINTGLNDNEQDIVQQSGASAARRIMKSVAGQMTPTHCVVLSYIGTPPTEVTIGYKRCSTRPFIATPIRCARCQSFGHKPRGCRKNRRCVKCGADHEYSACIVNRPEDCLCVNCGGQHSAAYRNCPAYRNVAAALQMMANKGIAYKAAQAMVIQGEQSRQPPPASLPVTSTPIAATSAQSPPPQSTASASSATAAPPTPRSAAPSFSHAPLPQRIRPTRSVGGRKPEQQPPAAQPGGAKPATAVSDTAEQQQAALRAEPAPVAAPPAETAVGDDRGATLDDERQQQTRKLDALLQQLTLCLAGIVECIKAQSLERGTALSGLARDFITQLHSQAV